jgi:hypothetical protein
MVYTLYKEIRTKGTLYEDGADTRNTEEEYIFISDANEEEYKESLVSEYESMDYGYSFDCVKVAVFQDYEIEMLIDAIKELEKSLRNIKSRC